MKKILVALLLLSTALLLAACGISQKETDTKKTESVSYISKTEAEVYFYEITSVYRGELLLMTADQLKGVVMPAAWQGLAQPVSSQSYADLDGTYINDDERAVLSKAYGSKIDDLTFDVYALDDLQSGADTLFGPAKVDVSAWSGNNVDIADDGVFATAAGYLLCAREDSKTFDTQVYKIISVTPGENTATVKAYAVSVDNITNNVVYDMSATAETTDAAGNTVTTFKKLENADPSAYDFSAGFDENMSKMGITESSLGIIDFVFGIDGISIHLDHAAAE